MTKPKNLRLELHPYPHLRDDEGCVLANDYIDDAKIAFILAVVAAAQDGPSYSDIMERWNLDANNGAKD